MLPDLDRRWCSATTARSPPRPPTPGCGAGHTDPWVDQAARATYDAAYEGTGNWPFNTAFAASLAGDAFVTRLEDLRAAERYIAAGIPLVASVSFASGELTGAPISATAGHLLVIVGFTDDRRRGRQRPGLTQPARGVRRTYDRAELEAAWLGGSGGTVYVIHDEAHPLP